MPFLRGDFKRLATAGILATSLVALGACSSATKAPTTFQTQEEGGGLFGMKLGSGKAPAACPTPDRWCTRRRLPAAMQ